MFFGFKDQIQTDQVYPYRISTWVCLLALCINLFFYLLLFFIPSSQLHAQIEKALQNHAPESIEFFKELTPLIFSSQSLFLGTLALVLGLLYLHDQKILSLRQQSGSRFSLDPQGIMHLNQTLQLETQIMHEDDPFGQWKLHSPPEEDAPFSPQFLTHLHTQFQDYQEQLEINQEGIPRRCDTYLEVRTLPHLPSVLERQQVGVFTTQNVPQWSLFYWTGDLGVAYSHHRHDLATSTHMNRRTLAILNEVDFFQGGSLNQRSNCGVLANFFWCNSSTTPNHDTPYYLLPPHFLGMPNCVYVTTKKEGQICSGLLAFKEIKADEQLLMFVGFDAKSKAIDRHLKLYALIPWLVFFTLLTLCLQLYLYLLTF